MRLFGLYFSFDFSVGVKFREFFKVNEEGGYVLIVVEF